ncbi:MAG: FAD-binding and (Fe-S)-binding domain-containing protein [Opitutales bacterium]
MIATRPTPAWSALEQQLTGRLHTDEATRRIYATDASAYQELPQAVAIPETEADLVLLVCFAGEHGLGLIPRTAGTSLAGQCVGDGIVVDVSRHFTRILEIDTENGWVRCQPGVIRNELNQALEPHGLLFGPETSTQNRAMIGGMLGNNSCGSNSVKYGSTRDHVLEVTALLADGSKAAFGPLDSEGFEAKCDGPPGLETDLYRGIRDLLGDPTVRADIRKQFPKPEISRRNTGYALDLLMDAAPLNPDSDQAFHFGKLIAGSEGTLCLVTEVKLRCLPLPPPVQGLQCAQFDSIDDALRATQIAVKQDVFACELIDHFILSCTERSIEHRENRFFIQGDPKAVLVTEIRGETEAEVLQVTDQIEAELRAAGLGYAFPVLFGEDTVKIWDLRKAGLGLLGNMPGDAKPVPVVEDTAVSVDDLPAYIAEFNKRLKRQYGIECVHYAHAGSGEIHLRPIINLKTVEGNRMFRGVAETIAQLVKEYRGSLSGEHGDGRLRGEFIEFMIGPANYRRIQAVKQLWDPQGIFNPGKIVDTPSMNTQLRYTPGQETREPDTLFDWSDTNGMLGAAEMCNGSGDCRKTQLTGGTMCPSYMATRDERDTTRARANLLRQMLTEGPRNARRSLFDNPDVADVLDLCLSCKGCKKECPSTVDMAKLKAEFTQHYQDVHGVPRRSRLIADFVRIQKLARTVPWLWNRLFGYPPTRRFLNRLAGFHPERTIPLLPRQTFTAWFHDHTPQPAAGTVSRIWLLADEFTEYTDPHIGIAAVELLERLGYAVDLAPVGETGRTWLSKGLVREARSIIAKNIDALAGKVTADQPLVGLEPSALLTFRDEAIDLTRGERQQHAKTLAPQCLLLEEWVTREAEAGRISAEAFTDEPRTVRLHGHCFQKAITGIQSAIKALSLPRNYNVMPIPSGCCGMAGSFGYEQEHYTLSMDIGELVLFPAIRAAADQDLIVAPGTSCRHQIHDGTARTARHPAEVLRDALTL